MEKQEHGAPPDTRETGGLPPPNIPYFEGLSKPSKEEEEARTREYSGTLVQPPEPPEMRAASKGVPLGGPPPGAPQPCQMGVFSSTPWLRRRARASTPKCLCSRLSRRDARRFQGGSPRRAPARCAAALRAAYDQWPSTASANLMSVKACWCTSSCVVHAAAFVGLPAVRAHACARLCKGFNAWVWPKAG